MHIHHWLLGGADRSPYLRAVTHTYKDVYKCRTVPLSCIRHVHSDFVSALL